MVRVTVLIDLGSLSTDFLTLAEARHWCTSVLYRAYPGSPFVIEQRVDEHKTQGTYVTIPLATERVCGSL